MACLDVSQESTWSGSR